MEKIGANIFVETVYPGVNVGCIISDEGAICIDTPLLPGEAKRWMTRIQSLGAERVHFVIYTNGQQERTLGTQYLLRNHRTPHTPQTSTSRPIPRPRRVPFSRLMMPAAPDLGTADRRGIVLAHKLAWEQIKDYCTESFKQSMIETFKERDPDMVNLEIIAPQVTLDERVKLYVNDVTVTLFAAAPGMLWAWLPEQRVLFVGETVVVSTHPMMTVIDIQEWLAALEWLRNEPQFQEATIVPGRGHLCEKSATGPLMEYLGMAYDKTQHVYRAGRPKADLNSIAAELLLLYPVADGQRERVQRQIKLGLDDLYDRFKITDATST